MEEEEGKPAWSSQFSSRNNSHTSLSTLSSNGPELPRSPLRIKVREGILLEGDEKEESESTVTMAELLRQGEEEMRAEEERWAREEEEERF